MAKKLTDLTARTATADSDLIHVNSGGVDYKETKADFLQGSLHIDFGVTSLLTSQVSSLPVGCYFGSIQSYGHQTETGVPSNTNYHVQAFVYNSIYRKIVLYTLNTDASYVNYTYSDGSWATWVENPRRSEIASLNSSLTNSLIIGTPVTAQVSLSALGMQSIDISDLGSPPSISGYVHQYWILLSATYRFTPVGYGGTRVYYWVGTTSTSNGSMVCYPIYKKS